MIVKVENIFWWARWSKRRSKQVQKINWLIGCKIAHLESSKCFHHSTVEDMYLNQSFQKVHVCLGWSDWTSALVATDTFIPSQQQRTSTKSFSRFTTNWFSFCRLTTKLHWLLQISLHFLRRQPSGQSYKALYDCWTDLKIAHLQL